MKYCLKCKENKSIEEFSFRDKSKNIRTSHCKKCNRIAINRHYSLNKEYYKNKKKKRDLTVGKINNELLVKYLINHPCMDCSNTDIQVLQFDHVSGIKENNISWMMQNACSWEKILKEIKKCEVVCANCHIKRNYKRGLWNTKYMPLSDNR